MLFLIILNTRNKIINKILLQLIKLKASKIKVSFRNSYSKIPDSEIFKPEKEIILNQNQENF